MQNMTEADEKLLRECRKELLACGSFEETGLIDRIDAALAQVPTNAATAEGTLGSVNQAGSTPAPAVAAPTTERRSGKVRRANLKWSDAMAGRRDLAVVDRRRAKAPAERISMLKRAVESQKNDTRTDEQKASDGAAFIMGDGLDEAPARLRPSMRHLENDQLREEAPAGGGTPCVKAECCMLRKQINEHWGPENTRLQEELAAAKAALADLQRRLDARGAGE